MMKYIMAISCMILLVAQGAAGDVVQTTSQKKDMMMEPTVNFVEIPYENGTVRYRYSRYLADDKTKWIRHGLFQAFHPNGALASEGHYEHGLETGLWKDFHTDGQRASEGSYKKGKKIGVWKYWSADGALEDTEAF